MARRFGLFAACIPLVLAAYLTAFPPGVRPLQFDTESFTAFAAYRTSGYPMLLRLVELVTGDMHAIVPVQVWVFAASAAFLVLAAWSATRSRLVTLATAVCVTGNPIVALFHLKLLSDSLAYSLSLVVAALVFVGLRNRGLWPIVAMGLASGAAVAIRPSSLSLAVACGAFLWMTWPRDRRAAAARVLALVLPLAACAWAETAAYHAVHPERESILYRHLFTKAMLAPEPPVLDGPLGRLARDAHAAWAPIRASIASMPDYGTAMYMTARWEVHGQWTYVGGLDYAGYGIPMTRADGLFRIGVASLVQYPGFHAWHAARSLFALWYVPDLLTPAQGKVIDALMDGRTSVHGLAVGEITPNRPPMEWASLYRAIFFAGLVGPFPLIFLSLRKGYADGGDAGLAVGAVMSVYVIGQMVIVSLIAVSISRYSMGMFPVNRLSSIYLAAFAVAWAARGRGAGSRGGKAAGPSGSSGGRPGPRPSLALVTPSTQPVVMADTANDDGENTLPRSDRRRTTTRRLHAAAAGSSSTGNRLSVVA